MKKRAETKKLIYDLRVKLVVKEDKMAVESVGCKNETVPPLFRENQILNSDF